MNTTRAMSAKVSTLSGGAIPLDLIVSLVASVLQAFCQKDHESPAVAIRQQVNSFAGWIAMRRQLRRLGVDRHTGLRVIDAVRKQTQLAADSELQAVYEECMAAAVKADHWDAAP